MQTPTIDTANALFVGADDGETQPISAATLRQIIEEAMLVGRNQATVEASNATVAWRELNPDEFQMRSRQGERKFEGLLDGKRVAMATRFDAGPDHPLWSWHIFGVGTTAKGHGDSLHDCQRDALAAVRAAIVDAASVSEERQARLEMQKTLAVIEEALGAEEPDVLAVRNLVRRSLGRSEIPAADAPTP